MGGSGSGNWYRWDSKETTESQSRIDIRWLKKNGYLVPNTTGTLSWSYGGETSSWIKYIMRTDRMMLSYRFRRNGGEWQDVSQEVFFDTTPCYYGGFRKWFKCPRCFRRVAVLYGAGILFLCRRCYNLSYSSQQEGKVDRLMRKARKIRERLGASDNLTEPILFKPKYMHQTTFDRLRKEADLANEQSWEIMAHRLGIGFL